MTSIADIRKSYERAELNEDASHADPLKQFGQWLQEAIDSQVPEPNAMTLATVASNLRPSTRVVLIKGYDERGIVWYTNYESRKGQELAGNPYATLQFHWVELERVVRIEGVVEKVSDEESDEYFASRPWDNRVGSWASDQSEPIADRTQLFAKAMEVLKQHGVGVTDLALKGNSVHIPRPPHWGGFRIWVDRLEVWLGSSARFHDRAVWTRDLTLSEPPSDANPRPDVSATAWTSTRLQP